MSARLLHTIKKVAWLLGVYDDRDAVEGIRAALRILRYHLTEIERSDCEARGWDPSAYCVFAAIHAHDRAGGDDARRVQVAEPVRLGALVGVPVKWIEELGALRIELVLAGAKIDEPDALAVLAYRSVHRRLERVAAVLGCSEDEEGARPERLAEAFEALWRAAGSPASTYSPEMTMRDLDLRRLPPRPISSRER